MKHFKIVFSLYCLCLVVCQLNGQNIVVSGIVTDSLQVPLAYANVLAMPEAEDQEVRYAITEENGSFKLGLTKNQRYELTISYLGYKPHAIQLTTTEKDISQSFVLVEAQNQLDEVILNYTPPIIVKKDFISFKVDAFTTGEERKLRDIIKKLPGVEVDKLGNVTVQGKKVTKVLVEDKNFFTGNSKLAVNNIPADAVDKVEILDDYNDVSMLKGLQDSDELAMNIKLKADKKKFVFGDIELGAGIKERYLVHPTLFYYSPKTSVNFIGDFNNQGTKSFSFMDYMEFEGGVGALIKRGSNSYNGLSSDMLQFLNNQDYKASTNQFGALNIRRSINTTTDITGYIISSKSKTDTESISQTEYLSAEDPFVENRTFDNKLNNFFTIGKLMVNYKPSSDEDFAYNSFVKLTNTESHGLINTLSPTQDNNINTLTDVVGLNLKQNISYTRKLSKKHTGTLEATYSYQNDKPLTEWLTNQQILQGLIPLETDDVYNILQTKKTKSHQFEAIAKDYWVLNNFNHIYTSVGLNMAFNDFYNEDLQLLTDGSTNNFNTANFNNDFGYNFIDTFIGLEYKFKIGMATMIPMLYAHSYHWTTKQLDGNQNHSKNLLLPQMTTKIEFSNGESIDFKYSLNARFSSIESLADNFILSDFNSVFKGNSNLENELYHSLSLGYRKFSAYRNLQLNLNSIYTKKVSSFKTVTQLEGIDQFNTQILFDQPEHNWSVNGRISKRIHNIIYKLSGQFRYNDFHQILNNQTRLNISKTLSSTVSAETRFRNYPNVELGYAKDFSNYRSLQTTNNFENNRFFANLQYKFLKDFILKADYSLDSYVHKNTAVQNEFDTANASLFYQKEDSPWGFEINATNLFDSAYKQQNSFSSFLISDSKTYIMPRIVMFKVLYKL